jgi:microcystin-dependent protein
MAEPFIGQLLQVGFTFAPRGYAICAGQQIAIAQNTALFALLGTTYGGNGQTTFALPDLRGRVAVGTGNGPGLTPIVQGEVSGTETVTLLSTNLPAHNHTATFDGSSSQLTTSSVKATQQAAAAGSLLGRGVDSVGTAVPLIYAPAGSAAGAALGGLNVAGTVSVGVAGGNQPFGIRNPYLGILHIIALEGIFPSRN